MTSFSWIGEEVQCTIADLPKETNTFYSSFKYNDEIYNIEDPVIIRQNNGPYKICKLLKVYESSAEWHKTTKYRGIVRWYSYASELTQSILRGYIYDEKNEIVEDYRNPDIFVSLKDVIKKCFIIYATLEDPVHLIKALRLNAETDFSCRYKLLEQELIPYFEQLNVSELNILIQHAQSKKEKLMSYDSSPTKPSAIDSQESSSALSDTSIINYSIVDSDDCNDVMKLKLRMSKSQPKVMLTNLSKRQIEQLLEQYSPQKKLQVADQMTSSRRHSKRSVARRNYADLLKFKSTSYDSEHILSHKNICLKHSEDTSDSDSKEPLRKIFISNNTPKKGKSYKQNETSSDNDIVENLQKVKISNNSSKNDVDVTPPKRMKRSPKRKNTDDELSKILSPLQLKTPKKRDTNISNYKKMLKNGTITPSMHSRKSAVINQGTPLKKACSKLHVSYVPKVLPCRENEFHDTLAFIKGKLLDGCGGCMYISGVPGTGKTATVTSVINDLQELSNNKKVPEFDYVCINGMRLTEPRQAYVEIYKQLHTKTVPWEQAHTLLEAKFTKKQGKSQKPIVLLVDELDILCTKRQDVVYNLLDWPTKASGQLIVITIANTMDLPERLLMGRVTSRLGLTRLTFQAYTYKQLQEIVTKRLMGTDAFNPDAVQLVARKVASVSGDARRALDICRRAAELAELEGPDTLVSMSHVNSALNSMITQPKVQAIKKCTRLEKLILQSIVAETERTGVEETTFADVFRMLKTVAGIDGFKLVSSSLALAAVTRLGSCRLLLNDPKTSDTNQKLILNVSADDIYYALRKD